MEKKYFTISIPILIALFAIFSMTPQFTGQGITEEMGTPFTDITKPTGNPCFILEKHTGITRWCQQNTVTNIAKNQTRDIRMGRITSTATANTTWSALILSDGTTAAGATDTTCEATVFTSNGCEAVNGTVSEVKSSMGNYSVFNKFEATGAGCAAIAKICLCNHTASTSPLMASAKLNSAVTLTANENLTVYYYMAES